MPTRLDQSFYCRDVLIVAPALIGASLVRSIRGCDSQYVITEVEAYRGEEDQASHARFGRTARNAVMYDQGGRVYVYLIYGMYWMLNIVTGPEHQAQAVLIRGLAGYSGPGILTRALSIDRSFYGEDLVTSDRIWVEAAPAPAQIIQTPRIGIDYAGEPWKSHHWRFTSGSSPQR
jgi:DNA-3-methyladenine glycosylase